MAHCEFSRAHKYCLLPRVFRLANYPSLYHKWLWCPSPVVMNRRPKCHPMATSQPNRFASSSLCSLAARQSSISRRPYDTGALFHSPCCWRCVLKLGRSYRRWLLLSTVVVCGIGEIIGWGGRLWTSYSPRQEDAFFMA